MIDRLYQRRRVHRRNGLQVLSTLKLVEALKQ